MEKVEIWESEAGKLSEKFVDSEDFADAYVNWK